MPERARAAWWLIDEFGSRIPGATVEVRNAANTALITDTLYAADDPDGSVLPNPFTSDVNGKAEAYLTNAKRAIFRFSKTGITTVDVPVDFTFPANRFLWRTLWVNTTAYVANDVVRYNGESWVALRASTGVTPVEGADWSLMAAKGELSQAAADARYQALSDLAYVSKAVTESVASSTALQDDDELFFAIGANQTWLFEAWLAVSGPEAADIKLAWAVPTGATGGWGGVGPSAAMTSADPLVADGVWRQRGFGDAGFLVFGVEASFGSFILCKGRVVNGGTAGNVRLRWAQNVSNATAVNVGTGTYITARKVAG